jgi:predicted phosphodiesterase
MIQQNRTIWFVRESKTDDPHYEVVLLNAKFFKPTDFSKEYFHTNSNTILWLSDTHFSDNIFPQKDSVDKKSLWRNIRQIIKESSLCDFGALLISGDVTSHASKDGFDKAVSFIGDINRESSYQLSSENILFCPGNHDFAFSYDAPDITPLADKSSANFTDFYKEIHKLAPNKYCASGRKLLLSNGIAVEIVALNSLILQQFSSFEGQGFLSEDQLNFVAEHMKWKPKKETRTIRIAMMHHHYIPTCFQDDINVGRASSVVYDAERLIRWMQKYNVRILLHGHKHIHFYSQVYHPIDMDGDMLDHTSLFKVDVIGMGSTGSKEIPDGQTKMFSTITFEPSCICFNFYKLDDQSSDKRIKRIKLSD